MADKDELNISHAEIMSPTTLLEELNSQRSDEKDVSKRKLDDVSGMSGNIKQHYNYTPRQEA